MPTLEQNATVLVTIVSRSAAQTLLNTLHYRYDAPAPSADYVPELEDMIAKLKANNGICDLMQDMQATATSQEEVWAQPVYPSRYFAIKDAGRVPSNGAYDEQPLPPNCALTITKRTVQATRWGIGSFHLGGLPASTVDADGEWGAPFIVQAALLADALSVGIPALQSTAFWRPILWSLDNPSRQSSIFACTPQTTCRVMRRRTVRLGI